MIKNKKAQEEMVGFGLIIVIVLVILLVFLWFSASKSKSSGIESQETDSFVSSILQYTTGCENSIYGYLDVQNLIFSCNEGKTCKNGANSCEILENELNVILEESFLITNSSAIKGYSLNISVEEKQVILLEKGNLGGSSKGRLQQIPKSGDIARIGFSLYY